MLPAYYQNHIAQKTTAYSLKSWPSGIRRELPIASRDATHQLRGRPARIPLEKRRQAPTNRSISSTVSSIPSESPFTHPPTLSSWREIVSESVWSYKNSARGGSQCAAEPSFQNRMTTGTGGEPSFPFNYVASLRWQNRTQRIEATERVFRRAKHGASYPNRPRCQPNSCFNRQILRASGTPKKTRYRSSSV
jgi:hypothetical protein